MDARRVPPIEERFAHRSQIGIAAYAPPPRPRSRSVATPASRVLVPLVLGCVVVCTASFFGVMYWWQIAGFVRSSVSVHHVAVGMLFAVAFVLWGVSEGQRFRPSLVVARVLAGGLFGFLGGSGAAGAGANEAMQTAGAGLLGGTGPKYIDKAAEALLSRAKGGPS